MDQDIPQWNTADERTDTGLSATSSSDHGIETGPSTLARIGILAFAIFAFFFFLVLKLPEARIQNYIIAHIRIIAQQQGFSFAAEKVRLGLLLGPSLKLYNLELKALDNERQVLKIPYLKIRPRLLSMIGSVKKAGITAELLEGEVSGVLGGSQKGSIHADLDIDDIDLGSTTVLKRFLPVDLSAKINGFIRLSIDGENIQKSEGEIKLDIDKLILPPQQLLGFNLPKLSVSEAKMHVTIAGGQFAIREFQLGKDGSNDDLIAKITGEGTLNKMLDRSTINAKAVFSLSQNIKSSMGFLDMILASAKTPDGKYAYTLRGSLSALEPVPGR